MSGWYLGPAGAMREIPPPLRGLEVARESAGSVVTSLEGTRTVYRSAQPRSWPLAWPTLSEDELTYLRSVGLGLVPGPLRLIDPMARNLLPVQVATGGSYRRDTSRWSSTGGSTASWVPVNDPPEGVPVRGAVSWVRTTTAAATLAGGDTADRVPLVPGRAVRCSVWARGSAVAAAAAVDAYDAAGAAARTMGPSVTLHATDWRHLAVDYTPATGRVSVAPLLTVAAGQAVSTVQITGWQVAFVDGLLQPQGWTEGGGAPEVLVDPGKTSLGYERWRRYAYQMVLLERRV